MINISKRFEEIFELNGKLTTINAVPKQKVYGEQLIFFQGKEYREWNPFRSKIAGAIKKGLRKFPIKKGDRILYLGAAEGTTISHLSDIVGEQGLIVGIDLSPRVMHKLMFLSEQRKNIIPLLEDAAHPEEYVPDLEGINFDFLYQDISQKNQAEIFCRNADLFLKRDGFAMLAIKAKSISQTLPVQKIFEMQKQELKGRFNILETLNLHPFDKEHQMISCVKK
ncbi:MAG: fibrillarin-like rRNA/tRNA 2'-O-methyltransferase [archaeon]|nr:fibrillarin-like rRNA/tRNA 2'-O-methyltransferase [archaeon]